MMTTPPRPIDLAPVRVLVSESFAPALAPLIDVPHQLATYHSEGDDSLAARLRDTDVFVSSLYKAAWSRPATRLRLIQGVGAGTDSIDLAAVPVGCTVCNVYGHEWAVAEYCFMTMMMLNRDVVAQDAALRHGNWSGGVFRRELRARTLLVLGLGHIGAEVVRWGRFLGLDVIALTRAPSAERARQHGLDTLGSLAALHEHLPAADFVVVAIPHTPATTGFIGQAEFERMKRSAYLVNVARGPVVDEAALYHALRDRTIAGAANDVWYRYPATLDETHMPATWPLHELDNLIMTPHNAGTTDGTMTYRFAFIAANIGRFYRGEPLHNVVHSSEPAE